MAVPDEKAIRATLDVRARELVDPERAWDDAKTFAHHYLQERHAIEALKAQLTAIRAAIADHAGCNAYDCGACVDMIQKDVSVITQKDGQIRAAEDET